MSFFLRKFASAKQEAKCIPALRPPTCLITTALSLFLYKPPTTHGNNPQPPKGGFDLLPKGVLTFCPKGYEPFAQRGADLLPKGVRTFCPKGYYPFGKKTSTPLGKVAPGSFPNPLRPLRRPQQSSCQQDGAFPP